MRINPSSKRNNEFYKLKQILPSNCVFHISDNSYSAESLYPEERNLTSKMSHKRLTDFSSGRYCMKKALSQLGINNHPILVGENRAPVLPANIIGSISHCEQFAVAVVMKKVEFAGIGVDVEEYTELSEDLLPLICTEAEIKPLQELDNPLLHAKIIFSVKESIYKCLNPIVNTWIDFLDVEVKINPAVDQIDISITKPELQKLIRHKIIAKTQTHRTSIVSVVFYPSDDQ